MDKEIGGKNIIYVRNLLVFIVKYPVYSKEIGLKTSKQPDGEEEKENERFNEMPRERDAESRLWRKYCREIHWLVCNY